MVLGDSEFKTSEYILQSKLCFVLCFHFMCMCMYKLGHDENEFLTMDHSQKNFERYSRPHFIEQPRIIFQILA